MIVPDHYYLEKIKYRIQRPLAVFTPNGLVIEPIQDFEWVSFLGYCGDDVIVMFKDGNKRICRKEEVVL